MGNAGRRGGLRGWIEGVAKGPGQGVRRAAVGKRGDHVAPAESGHRHFAHRLGQDGDGIGVLGGASGEGVLDVEDDRVGGRPHSRIREPIGGGGGHRLDCVGSERGVDGPGGHRIDRNVHLGYTKGHRGTSVQGQREAGGHLVLDEDFRARFAHASLVTGGDEGQQVVAGLEGQGRVGGSVPRINGAQVDLKAPAAGPVGRGIGADGVHRVGRAERVFCGQGRGWRGVDDDRGGIRSSTAEHADPLGHHRVGAGFGVEVSRGPRSIGIVHIPEVPLDFEGHLGRCAHGEGDAAIGVLHEGGVGRPHVEAGQVGGRASVGPGDRDGDGYCVGRQSGVDEGPLEVVEIAGDRAVVLHHRRPDRVHFPEPFGVVAEVEGVALEQEGVAAADLTAIGLHEGGWCDRDGQLVGARAPTEAGFHDDVVVQGVLPVVGRPRVGAVGIRAGRAAVSVVPGEAGRRRDAGGIEGVEFHRERTASDRVALQQANRRSGQDLKGLTEGVSAPGGRGHDELHGLAARPTVVDGLGVA